MDGFGMVLMALTTAPAARGAGGSAGDQPQDFKRFDLEALKQPEEVRARCGPANLISLRRARLRMDTNSRQVEKLNSREERRTAAPNPKLGGTFFGVKWTQIFADGSVTGEPRLSSRVVLSLRCGSCALSALGGFLDAFLGLADSP